MTTARGTSETIDLRSDTLTHPTEAMRRAMATSIVGDDVYREDPTVAVLEERSAALMGKEEALFVPSGTMGNLIALMVQTRPGQRVVVPERSHIAMGESGGGAAIAGVQFQEVGAPGGVPDPTELEAALRPYDYQVPPVGLVVVENTHNFLGGVALSPEDLAPVFAAADTAGLPVHLDGARIFNASVALGTEPARLAAPAATVMFAFTKALAAPVGSMLCGPSESIHRARTLRKMLGGGMRQAGVLAGAALVGLDTMIDRIEEDHANAQVLAKGIAAIAPAAVDPRTVTTNIVIIDTTAFGYPASEMQRRLDAAGVRSLPVGGIHIRFVTHKDVGHDDVVEAVERIAANIAL